MSPKKTLSQKEEIAQLKAENSRLRRELTKQKPKSSGSTLKKALVILIASIAGALLVVGNILFWTGRTLTDTQKYTAVTNPLIENPVIQDAIATKATTELFSRVDVESIARDALPPRAQFLAPSLATQVENFTNQQAKNIVGSKEFQEVWQTVNERSHARLLAFVKNYQGDGTFDVADLYKQVSQRLEGGSLSFLANKQLPEKVGSITIISAPNLPKVHWIVVNLGWLRLVSILLFVGLTVLAVYLLPRKRKAIVSLGLLYGTLMLVTLISIRIGRTVMIDQVQGPYQAAATEIWKTVLHPLVLQTTALMIVFALIALIAWVTGGGRRAQVVRSRTTDLLGGRAHQAIFKHENSFTSWLGRNKIFVQATGLVLAVIALLAITLTPANIIILLIILLVFEGVTEVLASEK